MAGQAIEVRICAEDPAHNYRPCTGTLGLVAWPKRTECRVDTWVETGVEVSGGHCWGGGGGGGGMCVGWGRDGWNARLAALNGPVGYALGAGLAVAPPLPPHHLPKAGVSPATLLLPSPWAPRSLLRLPAGKAHGIQP